MMNWRAASQRPPHLRDAFHVVHFTGSKLGSEPGGRRLPLQPGSDARVAAEHRLSLCMKRSSRAANVSSQVVPFSAIN